MTLFSEFRALAFFSSILLSTGFAASSFPNTVITFNEPDFPSVETEISGKLGFNVLNDQTGSKISTVGELSAVVDDSTDIFLHFQNHSTATGSSSWQWQPTSNGRFTSTQALGETGATNNPGGLSSSTLTITFGDHLSVTDFRLTGSSFNTSGIAWEYAVIEFFRPDGSSFSTAPEISPFLDHIPINGRPSIGWFVIDSNATVLDVGGSKTQNSGINGPYDMLTTGLGYADVGLETGTEIGGVRITTYLEDVRGTANGNTNFSSSITSITLGGILVPEPGAFTLTLMATGLSLVRKRN